MNSSTEATDTGFITYTATTTIQTLLATTNSTLNNAEFVPTAETEGMRDVILGATLLAINVLIVVLNLSIIMVIARFRTKNTIDLFVLALASTDLVKGLIPIPMSIVVYLTDWYLIDGSSVCNFYGWIAFATNSGSMLILTFMSIERYMAIVKPFIYKAWVRPKKVLALLFVSWIFTAFHSSLPLIGVGRIKSYNDGAYSHFDYSRETRGAIAYSIFILCYGLSMIVVVMIAYSFVFHRIRDLIHRHRRMSNARSRTFSTAYSKPMRQLNLKTETMFSYLTVVLMILFWFSWLPFLVVVIASQIGAKPPHEKLDLFTMRIVVVNSMLNPMACAALCKPYRRGVLYYFKKCFSYVGFKKPDGDIWDPWNRYSRSHRNTRRLEPSVCEVNTRQSELYRSSYPYNEGNPKLENYPFNISSGSTSSGVSSSSSIDAMETATKRDKSASRKQSRNHGDNSKDHNKNLLGEGVESLSPSHSRKLILMEKVHKYLGQKRRRSNASKENLRNAQRTRRSNSASDILDIELCNDKKGKQWKTRSFAVKSYKGRKDSDIDLEAEKENEELLIRERVRSKTVNAIDEMEERINTSSTTKTNFTDTLNDNANQQLDNDRNTPPHMLVKDSASDTNEQNIVIDNNYKNGGVHLSKACSQEDILDVPAKETDRRCISETYSENMMILRNNKESKLDETTKMAAASEHSLVMIDRLTKDLVQFSQTSLNKKGIDNGRIQLIPLT